MDQNGTGSRRMEKVLLVALKGNGIGSRGKAKGIVKSTPTPPPIPHDHILLTSAKKMCCLGKMCQIL